MSVPARISITENASLGTDWHRAVALVVNREGFWKSVYERSRNGKECPRLSVLKRIASSTERESKQRSRRPILKYVFL